MGDWQGAYDFFLGLKGRGYEQLNGTTRIALRSTVSDAPRAFVFPTEINEKALIDSIAHYIRYKVAIEQSLEEVRTTLLSLLSAFTFVPATMQAQLEQDISIAIHPFVANPEDVSSKRNALLMSLQSVAMSSDGTINHSTLEKIFTDNGLNCRSISDWATTRMQSIAHAKDFLNRRNYSAIDDVRSLERRHCQSWITTKPILLIEGDSGDGKSWQLCSLLENEAQSNNCAFLAVDARQGQDTLAKLSEQMWCVIAGFGATQPLVSYSHRLTSYAPHHPRPWLQVYVDGIRDAEDLIQLCRGPWDTGNMVLVAACPRGLYEQVRNQLPQQFVPHTVAQFSDPEVDEWIRRVLGAPANVIPSKVKKLLKKPVLAATFAKLRLAKTSLSGASSPDGIGEAPGAEPLAWDIEDEHKLINEYWTSRITSVSARTHFLAAARGAMEGKYPWTGEMLCDDFNMTDGDILYLRESTWLEERDPNSFYVWHDRLLCWVIAQAILSTHRSGAINEIQSAELLSKASVTLGYQEVAQDYNWLRTRSKVQHPGPLDRLPGQAGGVV
jgi:hypothetical protein